MENNTEWVSGLDRQATADAVADARARLLRAEADRLLLAAHWADLHAEDSIVDSGHGGVLPGSERASLIGGDGTPLVGEFAAAELAALLGRSPVAAVNQMADALDLRHRSPVLWLLVLGGLVEAWKACQVARRLHAVGLSQAQCLWVDEQIGRLITSMAWSAFLELLEAKIVEVDPPAAEARRQAAEMERFVSTGRCNEYGLKTVIVKASAGDALCFVAACERIAALLLLEGDTDPVGARRSKAVGILANPARALLLLAKYAGTGDGNAADAANDSGDDKPAGDGNAGDHESATGAAVANRAGDAPTRLDPDEGKKDTDAADHGGADDADGAGDEPLLPADLHPRDEDSDDAAEGVCSSCGVAGPRTMSGDPIPFVKALATIDPKKLVPSATLYVHIAAEDFTAASTSILTNHDAGTGGPTGSTDPSRPSEPSQPAGTGVVRVEGVGPVTLGQAVAFLGHRNVTLKPVIDLAEDHPVDGYEVPARMREQLHLRSPVEVFPWSGNRSRGKDLDHTVPYVSPDTGGPPGQTRIGNLGPLGRYAHRVKTHGRGWRHRQPVPGVFLWRTPHGYWFRVDNTGTHELGKDPSSWELAGRPSARTHPDSPAEAALAALIAGHRGRVAG